LRDFQGRPAKEETWENSILIDDYLSALKNEGWKMNHMIQAPMSSERFNAGKIIYAFTLRFVPCTVCPVEMDFIPGDTTAVPP
jgi:hypothetical protein